MMSPSMTTDQAYETMFDDDDLLGNQQVMPWFDPNYMASNDNVRQVKSGVHTVGWVLIARI